MLVCIYTFLQLKTKGSSMKNFKLLGAIALATVAIFALAGCGAKQDQATTGNATSGSKVIKVGASPTPHAEILAQVKDQLKTEGYDLQVVEYTDYVIPNTAVENGELDANFFQHLPYLEDFNKEKGTHLVSVGGVHFEPLAVYGGKTKDIAALKSGAKIAVPNDTTNEARALLLLQDAGLITLKANADFTATPKDIVSNPKNIKFVEVEAAAVPRSLQEVDLAVINGNYALEAGLTSADQLKSEDASSDAAKTYENILVVKEGKQNDAGIKALYKALQSESVKKFIETKYQGSVIAMPDDSAK